MPSKKKGKAQAAADRIKAAAARNVNAYGQKEEGPSRWQEKREAKSQMYLMSNEKAVRLGKRKDLKTTMSSIGGTASQCEKCFQTEHWTYECKNERVYMSRPSRNQQQKSPNLKMNVSISFDLDNPYIKDEETEKGSKKSKRKHHSDSDSGSDSEASVFETDSCSSSVTGSDYSSGEKKQKKGRHRRYNSSSESSDSDSDPESNSESSQSDSDPESDPESSESDSDDRCSRRKRRYGRKR